MHISDRNAGQTVVEYTLVLALIVVVAILVAGVIAPRIGEVFSSINATIAKVDSRETAPQSGLADESSDTIVEPTAGGFAQKLLERIQGVAWLTPEMVYVTIFLLAIPVIVLITTVLKTIVLKILTKL